MLGTQSNQGRPNSHPLWAHTSVGKTGVWLGSFKIIRVVMGDTEAVAEPVGGTGPIPSRGFSERLPEEERVE